MAKRNYFIQVRVDFNVLVKFYDLIKNIIEININPIQPSFCVVFNLENSFERSHVKQSNSTHIS